MIPKKLTITPFTEGDSWDGLPALLIGIGPEGGPFVAPASPLTLVTMRFLKLGTENEPVVELSSANAAEILIVSAANWEISLPEQILPLTAGKWDWQICCVDSANKPKTYIGDVVEVLKKI